MTITTKSPPEAELEARITGTLQRVFPGIAGLLGQRRFKLRLGHTEFEGGTGKRDYVEGRADILVVHGEDRLAVLELKREGLPLTADDEAQGASYALLARAPLVVVTNGTETRLFQTHDMARIEGSSIEATELASRISIAASAAQSSVSGAITHDIENGEISCLRNGIAEPITWAIAEFLSHNVPGADRDVWVDDAIASNSLPLMNRLAQALTHLSQTTETSDWAEKTLNEKLRPALAGHPQFH
ncbi:type I restriction enzyme HsdR N-terminal domain-containing protein [Roseateles chitinivorans]|uniref:type I restriction enzyme HsdR N-terminal domain-containing protein n=1 Tax=Roseateles chitinivorans TaxID=2917965 RepID=UPI003D6648C8